MSVIVNRMEDTSFSRKEVFDLILDSFQERLQQGINYSLFSMSFEKYVKIVEKDIVLVAYDSESQRLLGTVTISIRENKKKETYAYMDFLATANNVKNHGVGTILFAKLKDLCAEQGCKYIESITSLKAMSSVRWHKKMGFKIIGYKGAGVYTYLFRWDFDKKSIYNNKLFVFAYKIFTYLYMISVRKPNGHYRWWVKYVRKNKYIDLNRRL